MSQFDITWSRFIIQDKRTAQLQGAAFEGPGISQAYKLLEKDKISIDLTTQFRPKLKERDFLIVEVEWNGIRYTKENKVELGNVVLRNMDIQFSKNITDSDFFRVYLAGHDEQNHYKNLVYISEVRDGYGEKLDFL